MDIVSICNLALLKIGQQVTIQSVTPPKPDGSAAAAACAVLYQPTMDALFGAAKWNFARKQIYLTQVKTAISTTSTSVPLADRPPEPFLYEYLYPDDCIMARFIPAIAVTASTSTSTVPFTTGANAVDPWTGWTNQPARFVVANDATISPSFVQTKVILTNQPQAQLIYTVRVTDPNVWDQQFVDAASSSLAAWLVPALALNMPLMNMQIKIAQGIINSARISDGNEGLTYQESLPDWIVARYQSSSWGWGGAGAASNMGIGEGVYGGFSIMSWPSGISY